jgi:aldose sugar dehydrogenase
VVSPVSTLRRVLLSKGRLSLVRVLAILAVVWPWTTAARQPTRNITAIEDGVLQTPYRIERVATDLRVPWGLMFLPDGRIIFTEREGRVRIIEQGRLLADPALSINVALGNKMGMLGITLDPHFDRSHFIYIAYDYHVTPAPGDDEPPFRLRVARYRLRASQLIEPLTLIEDIPASFNHTGCRLTFGPKDGKLYITTGDADRPLNAQRLDRLNGKILRLNADGSIPTDNPFVGKKGARGEIWSYGHRNPQGLVFEPRTYQLLDTEHGPVGGDEINWVQKGHNYGWPTIDHARMQKGMESPVFEFSPSVAPGEALFYQGDAFPELRGKLLIACLRGEGVLRVEHRENKLGKLDRLFYRQFGRIRSVSESSQGYLYLTTSQFDPDEGEPRPTYDLVLRIVPSNTPSSAYPLISPIASFPLTAVPGGTLGIIEQNCASCHGPGLEGGGMGQGLLGGHWKHATDDASLRRVISGGLIEIGMPANPQLRPEELDAIVAYLRTAITKPIDRGPPVAPNQ